MKTLVFQKLLSHCQYRTKMSRKSLFDPHVARISSSIQFVIPNLQGYLTIILQKTYNKPTNGNIKKLNRITSSPDRSSRQKVRPMRSNITQAKKVWARIDPAIHTKRPFTLFSFTLSDPSDNSKLHSHSSQASHLTNKICTYQTLQLPSLEKAKSLNSQTKSCHTTPQNYPSDKLDPEEVKRTGRWTRKKIEANTGDNIISQLKLSRK
jgi:hypothetical protein